MSHHGLVDNEKRKIIWPILLNVEPAPSKTWTFKNNPPKLIDHFKTYQKIA